MEQYLGQWWQHEFLPCYCLLASCLPLVEGCGLDNVVELGCLLPSVVPKCV